MKIQQTVLTVALGLATTAAAGTSPAAKGQKVTINGCVLAGTSSGSVVLTHVSEGSATIGKDVWLGAEGMTPGPQPQQVIYWLSHDSVKDVRAHAGHRVEITGTVTDVKPHGLVETKKEPGKEGRDNKIEVNAPHKDAKAKTEKDLGVGNVAASGQKLEETVAMPTVRIQVASVKSVATTCP